MSLAQTNGSGREMVPADRPALLAPMATGRAPRRADWLVAQLPVGMLDDPFFLRFVSMFQEQASTYLDAIDSLEHIIDPSVAPLPMLRFLAGWLGLMPLPSTADEAAYRRLVLRAAHLRWWRGTRAGLEELLALYTGETVEVNEEGTAGRIEHDQPASNKVSIRLGSTGHLSVDAFLNLVMDEVPAHVDLEIVVGESRIWPAPRAERDIDAR
ncbi:MAG TPA: phage tail protein [Acidimicrobiales bacterium]|nr:phage tail protein [Acidimicrobiales bacterium]